MTPREASAIMAGAEARLRREAEARIGQAWLGAWLTAYAPAKASAFPKLERLMPRRRQAVRNVEADFATLMGWARSFD